MSRSGFTLVEVLLAMTIGAMVLATLGELIGAAAITGRRLTDARAQLDSAAMGREWLRTAFRNAEAGHPGDTPFDGSHDAMQFSSRMPTANGWHAQDTVVIGLQGGSLVLRSAATGTLVLQSDVRVLQTDYLEQLGASSPWLPAYSSPSVTPLAIRLRVATRRSIDTLVFSTGSLP